MQNQVPVSQNRPVTGRFAPSPSGRLHLGNLACSLLAWLSAKSQGGRIVLRIEDLDAERCPRVYADLLEQDLAWLGLTWDEGGSTGGAHAPYYQSECGDIYTQSYRKLEQRGLVYPCFCSRSQLHAASAPHTSDGNVIYPGTCRGLTPEEIAEEMKMPVERVREILKISQEPVSLETPIGEEEDSHLGDFIKDDNVPVPADAATFTLLKEQLEEVLGTLTEREQKVLTLRFGLEDGRARTLEEVGKEFNVTRERIRQIEAKALRKLRHPSRSRKLKDYLE